MAERSEPEGGHRSLGVWFALGLLPSVLGSGCDLPETPAPGGERPEIGFVTCDLPKNFLAGLRGRDGIPSLDDPVWIWTEEEIPEYLDPDTRIIGIVAEGVAWAIPHNVLWYHEVVNFDAAGPVGAQLAVTYCPLTGSSLVFDRKSIGAATLGVSGILFMNNLVLYDRRSPEDTLWPQMLAEARCGSGTGARLDQFPFLEMEWAQWLELHPATYVIGGVEDQGLDPRLFDYTAFGYPYGIYREDPFFFLRALMPPLDTRRFSKERVVGLPSTSGDPGIAFPFGDLTDRGGSFQAVDSEYDGESAVLLWSDRAQGGSGYRPWTEAGTRVTLEPTDSGFVDVETGSEWTVEGRAVRGPLAGERLVPLERAHTAFWGAWAAFHPETRLWEG